ncbi:MAG: hypothetical protein LBE91_13685, partial [Tannerella sp.]|nr:hypothetical protein [Tannerella sp.]
MNIITNRFENFPSKNQIQEFFRIFAPEILIIHKNKQQLKGTSTMNISHIEHIGIAVKSIDERLPYYENVLG